MAKLPLTSKKSNLARLCVTARLNNLGCTRKGFWHLLFFESGQRPEELGLCLPELHTQDNSLARAWAGPVSRHTTQPASLLPPEKDVVTTDHLPLSPAPCGLRGWLPLALAWKRAASSRFPDGDGLSRGPRLGQKWFLSRHASKMAAGRWSLFLVLNTAKDREQISAHVYIQAPQPEPLPSKRAFPTCWYHLLQ